MAVLEAPAPPITRSTDVEDVLRSGGFTRFHRRAVAVTGFAWTFVAMEILLVGFTVPVFTALWGISGSLAGWITASVGQTAEAERWAAIADAASFDLVPLDGSASFDSARAMLRAVMVPAGPQQALADASFAVAQEPPSSPWRDTALCVCAEAHLLAGDVDRAAVLFAE